MASSSSPTVAVSPCFPYSDRIEFLTGSPGGFFVRARFHEHLGALARIQNDLRQIYGDDEARSQLRLQHKQASSLYRIGEVTL